MPRFLGKLVAMASNLRAMASNLIAMASNLRAMASNLIAMASNLEAIWFLDVYGNLTQWMGVGMESCSKG